VGVEENPSEREANAFNFMARPANGNMLRY
jgi:hypothetical protein